MEIYKDINNDSGVAAYELGIGSIVVQFSKGSIRNYEYLSSKIGATHISNMHRLAVSGDGLNSYIGSNPEVKNGFSRKW